MRPVCAYRLLPRRAHTDRGVLNPATVQMYKTIEICLVGESIRECWEFFFCIGVDLCGVPRRQPPLLRQGAPTEYVRAVLSWGHVSIDQAYEKCKKIKAASVCCCQEHTLTAEC